MSDTCNTRTTPGMPAVTCAMLLVAVQGVASAALIDGLVGHWSFGDSGDLGLDSSPLGNHGSLVPAGSGPVWTSDAAVGAGSLSFDGYDAGQSSLDYLGGGCSAGGLGPACMWTVLLVALGMRALSRAT